MLKFDTFILEWKRETKKPKSNYYTKRIAITKTELEYLCDKLELDFSKLKFISSGSFGNAYRLDDKVLKVTIDKREAKSVYDLIKSGGNESIVKYYSVNRYKDIYVILMDYTETLRSYIKDMSIYSMIDDCLDILYKDWRKVTKDELLQRIGESWGELNNYNRLYIDKVWRLYTDIKDLVKKPDLHMDNLGINKEGQFVIFDFSDLIRVRKFDDPKII